MTYNMEKIKIRIVEILFFAIGVILLLILGAIASGHAKTEAIKVARAHSEVQQPLYRMYRGVRLGMTATETRAKLGEPVMKSDEQDFYVFSANETAQIVYIDQKVVTISADYTGGLGAPDSKSVVGDGLLLQKPDGSLFRMVVYDSEHFWVSYHKSASVVPVVTITIGTLK